MCLLQCFQVSVKRLAGRDRDERINDAEKIHILADDFAALLQQGVCPDERVIGL